MKLIKKVLVANRGEIAIRILRACFEMNMKTVALYTYEDRYSLHRYKSDEAYQIGDDDQPLKPYLNMDEIIRLAKSKNVDAIHPGYGFLSENAEFARKCQENDIIFIGPTPETMALLGDKIAAKKIAVEQNVPIIESSKKALVKYKTCLKEAREIGFPVILKAASGGGGRGMRVVHDEDALENSYNEAQREALNAFGDSTVFLEKFVEKPKHIEVQICADNYGNIVHLFERDCSVQRRFQKVVEIAPAPNLGQETKEKLYEYALKICRAAKYSNVGTVEFLVDEDEKIYFIEVNTRIQVEHTVTEVVTGVDLVKAQIRIAMGYKIGRGDMSLGFDQKRLRVSGHAIQCRLTTEDPENDFKPDYGTIVAYRSGAGFGIRVDEGSVYPGVMISPFFDSMLVKVTASAYSLDGAARKMTRALYEFRFRGLKTNIPFLINIVNHPVFKEGKATVNFIKDHPELFVYRERLDRATKILKFLGETIVNGNADVKAVDKSRKFIMPIVPPFDKYAPYPEGSKQLLDRLGPEAFCEEIKKDKKIHYTDTTFRDAHQSLLATRVRSLDMLRVAESFAKHHPQLFSMEVWGGATFDVTLRFLKECPWKRLTQFRKAIPNTLLQMLFRGSNAVGYSAYPDNLIESFIEKSWETGVDVFRIFDSLNWLKGMEQSIKFVRRKTKGIAEVALCYTGDILDPKRTKYDLNYYVKLATQIESAGAHILAIKDMAGLLKPYAAGELIKALRATISIPIHLHTHDTSSLQSATYLKAVEAGVDIIDVALGGLSGLTSQPNFNAIVEMLRYQKREREFDVESLNEFSSYWENVRELYYPFESDMRAGSAEVFKHEIPGGQYSNLKPQAVALGLGEKFDLIKKTFAEVNMLFGDIVKVTPSSKVVGDMAQFLVTNGFTVRDVLERGDVISFPESVKQLLRGDLGQTQGGFPKKLQKIILRDEKPYTNKPNAHLTPLDLEKDFAVFKTTFGDNAKYTDYLSYKMFPKVFEEYWTNYNIYGDVSRVPTKNFFFGMELNEEVEVEMTEGKTLLIRLLSVGPADKDGNRTVFFKLNGQTRNIVILDKSLRVEKIETVKVDKNNAKQIGSPLPGMLSKIFAKNGDKVTKNQPLFIIEAMKMETIVAAPLNGVIANIFLSEKQLVVADTLIVELV
ncbi:MAG: pyruvate carboxylase [Pyrinomonadaceae bacterium]